MTLARARSEGTAIIIEYESDETIPNEAVFTASDVEKSVFVRNIEGGGQKAESIR